MGNEGSAPGAGRGVSFPGIFSLLCTGAERLFRKYQVLERERVVAHSHLGHIDMGRYRGYRQNLLYSISRSLAIIPPSNHEDTA